MHSPQYQRWSLELQQAFGAGTSVSIGYFGHHGIHELLQDPNANAFGFGSLPSGQCTSPPVPPCADPRFSEVTEYRLRMQYPTTTAWSFLLNIGSGVGLKACFRPTIRTAMPSMRSQMGGFSDLPLVSSLSPPGPE